MSHKGSIKSAKTETSKPGAFVTEPKGMKKKLQPMEMQQRHTDPQITGLFVYTTGASKNVPPDIKSTGIKSKASGPSLLSRQSAGKPGLTSLHLQAKGDEETEVTDVAFELKMRHTTNNFYSEQEECLAAEKLALSEKTQVLRDEIAAMAKLELELETKIMTVANLLEREQALSDQYSANIVSTKEAIASGRVYIKNMRDKIDNMEDEKRRQDYEIAERHKEISIEVEEARKTLAELQESIEEIQEERDDLWNRWQAKLEIQKHSDLESSIELKR